MKLLIKLSLLFLTTLTFIACGGDSNNPQPVADTPPQSHISIANQSGEEGGDITFTVTAEPTIAEQVSFDYRVVFDNLLTQYSATPNDLNSSSLTGTNTIKINDSSTAISIAIKDDLFNEQTKTFRVVLSNLSQNATFTKNTAIGTIKSSDPDGALTNIRIIDNYVAGNEGAKIDFRVEVAQIIAEQIVFDYRVAFDNPLTLNSASAADLDGLTGSGTIAANNSSTTISIDIKDDNIREINETFLVVLSNPFPASINFTDQIAMGTIATSDNTTKSLLPVLVPTASTKENTSAMDFQVLIPFTTLSTVSFDYEATIDNPITNKSASTSDFTAMSGSATIPINQDSTTISISLNKDNIIEFNETFRLLLTNPSDKVIFTSNPVIGTILNDDSGEISNVSATAGNTQVILNWTNPSGSIFEGETFEGVTIAHATGATAPADCSSGRQIGAVTSHNVTGLTFGSTYSFRICARYSDFHSNGVEVTNLTLIKIDSNNNGLIDIHNATEFNNIRYNLAGTSYKTSSRNIGNAAGCPNIVCNGYELMNDINLSSYTNWSPIGSYNDRFSTTFNGNNHTISGLNITGIYDYMGLFSAMQNAKVSNLKVADVSIVATNKPASYLSNFAGAVAGYADNSTFSNIELIGDASQEVSNAELRGTGKNIGGLVGELNAGTITNSSSSLTVRGGRNDLADNVGGLVGYLNRGEIRQSNNSGAVYGSEEADSIGGLVGENQGSIKNSWASGNVLSIRGRSSRFYGGLVGRNHGSINQSWASGNVTSVVRNAFYGGLVGYNVYSGIIINSWASGNVSSTANLNLIYGGLAGENKGRIAQSWAGGKISADSRGGLIGRNNTAGRVMGRNYQLDSSSGSDVNLANDDGIGISFVLADATALANLSGATSDGTSDWGAHSGWHAGFELAEIAWRKSLIPRIPMIDLETRFCDTDNSGTIELDEQKTNNSIWVMPSVPTGSDNVAAPTMNEAGQPQNYYAIPAIRCIGTTPAERQENIDLQRRLFPQP